ncbi:hypothetical protein [Sphingobacterium daejeonense]|uniref:hypothetical protein n=1 Tax=Sphingobacterium daejeonense TaxID=371142 RepID=UPI0010C44075|nr:hypothetical protein [Sphingobacterium daejeonense]VTQ01338.1 Uncharacterised protein [Sphingobacterium daejeonense]
MRTEILLAISPQAQGRANTEINIPAYRNKQYLCIVYSYNSEADIPPFDPSNPFLNISASSSLGTDFLFPTDISPHLMIQIRRTRW